MSKRMSPGMLRSRRRDACVKPNRVLDKSSSRGMIYENEELRLRTININAEIERGQSEVKKLRKENEHLRREIWCLREEVDRLEALLKHKELEENSEDEEESEEEDKGGGDEECEENGETGQEAGEENRVGERRVPRVVIEPDSLSVVPEESEEGGSTPEPVPRPPQPLGSQENYECNKTSSPGGCLEEYQGVLPACIRLNCVHPFTAAVTLPPEFRGLTVTEVIQTAGTVCPDLVGVRLLEGALYVSAGSRVGLEALTSSGLTLRGRHLPLQDVSQGTVVLALSGLPHATKDAHVAKLLSQFGPIIGGVERRVYLGTDTGEGLARIRPLASLPKRLYLDGAEVNVRPLSHEELSKLSMQQKPILNKAPNLNLKLEKDEVKFSDPKTAASTSNKAEPFIFPVPSTSTSTQSTPKLDERCQSAPLLPGNRSPTSLRVTHSDGEAGKKHRRVGSRRGKSPSSSSEQDSPAKPFRRRASILPAAERERSQSLSSRASFPRKMSVTGRETGKMPWCACWGNGCL